MSCDDKFVSQLCATSLVIIFVTRSSIATSTCLNPVINQKVLHLNGGPKERCGGAFPHQSFLILSSETYLLLSVTKKNFV